MSNLKKSLVGLSCFVTGSLFVEYLIDSYDKEFDKERKEEEKEQEEKNQRRKDKKFPYYEKIRQKIRDLYVSQRSSSTKTPKVILDHICLIEHLYRSPEIKTSQFKLASDFFGAKIIKYVENMMDESVERVRVGYTCGR